MDVIIKEVLENLISSSSETDSSETSFSSLSTGCSSLEYVFEPKKIKQIKKKRKTGKPSLFVTLQIYNEDEFKECFKMSKTTIEHLIDLYSKSNEYRRKSKGKSNVLSITAERQMYLFIFYMTNKESFGGLANIFDVSKGAAWRSCTNVSTWLVSLTDHFIQWPMKSEQFVKIDNDFQNSCRGVPGIIGAIDCVDIRIKEPKSMIDSHYNREMKYHSIKLQGIVTASRKFINIYCGEPGGIDKCTVFRNSPIYCTNGLGDNTSCSSTKYFIVADVNYPTVLPWLVTPFHKNDNLTGQERRFNILHELTLLPVQQTFALLKCRFERLDNLIDCQNIDFVVNIVKSACVLHNICIDRNDEFLQTHTLPPVVMGSDDRPPLESHDGTNTRGRQLLFLELLKKRII